MKQNRRKMRKTCYHCMYSGMDTIELSINKATFTLTCNKHNLICDSKSSACAFFEWDKKLLKSKLLQDLEKCRVSMLKLSKDMYTLCGETENAWMWQKLELEADETIGGMIDILKNVDISNEVE